MGCPQTMDARSDRLRSIRHRCVTITSLPRLAAPALMLGGYADSPCSLHQLAVRADRTMRVAIIPRSYECSRNVRCAELQPPVRADRRSSNTRVLPSLPTWRDHNPLRRPGGRGVTLLGRGRQSSPAQTGGELQRGVRGLLAGTGAASIAKARGVANQQAWDTRASPPSVFGESAGSVLWAWRASAGPRLRRHHLGRGPVRDRIAGPHDPDAVDPPVPLHGGAGPSARVVRPVVNAIELDVQAAQDIRWCGHPTEDELLGEKDENPGGL